MVVSCDILFSDDNKNILTGHLMSNQNGQATQVSVSFYPETKEIVDDVDERIFHGRNFSGALRYILHDWLKRREAEQLAEGSRT